MIVEVVVDYIFDGLIIFIIIGTIVEYVVRVLFNYNYLWIIINSLCVVYIFYYNLCFEVMVFGGMLCFYNSGIIGFLVVFFVVDFCVDYLVISVGVIESDGVLMEFDVNEVNVVKMMMVYVRNILLVVDYIKYYVSVVVEIGNVV